MINNCNNKNDFIVASGTSSDPRPLSSLCRAARLLHRLRLYHLLLNFHLQDRVMNSYLCKRANAEAVPRCMWCVRCLYLAVVVRPAAQVFLRLNVTFNAHRFHTCVGRRRHICHLTLNPDKREPVGGNLLIWGQLQLTRQRLRLLQSYGEDHHKTWDSPILASPNMTSPFDLSLAWDDQRRVLRTISEQGPYSQNIVS